MHCRLELAVSAVARSGLGDSRRLMRARARILLLSALLLVSRAGAAALYNIYDLGSVPGGSNTLAIAINNSGQIVGFCQVGAGKANTPVFWTNVLSAPLALSQSGSTFRADSINNTGEIVGGDTSSGGLATFWTNSASAPVYLALQGDAPRGEAEGINSSGQIVGRVKPLGSGELPAFWTNSSSLLLPLDHLGGTNDGGFAHAINDAGQIVGETGPNKNQHATYWANSSSLAVDLGTLGGSNSLALGINNAGQIVGLALDSNELMRAVFWPNGASPATELQALGNGTNGAACINNLGQIVGVSGIVPSAGNPLGAVAVLWTNLASAPVDLNTLIPANSGWVLVGATAINDSGEIVGFGVVTNNGFVLEAHAFALIPTNPPASGADLSLNVSALSDPVAVGTILAYEVTVSNAGPSTATNVVMTNVIPANTTFVVAGPGKAATTNGVLTWSVGNLAVGSARLLTVEIVPSVIGPLANEFGVFSSAPDPVPGNNVFTLVTQVANSTLTNVVLYNVVDLGPSGAAFGSSNSEALAVNNPGQIVGDAVLSGGYAHAAFWTNILTPPINIGDPNPAQRSQAVALNNSGQMVGRFYGLTNHAVYWTNSASPPFDLGANVGGDSEAKSINDSGEMVGYANFGGGFSFPCFWTNNSSPPFNLGTLGGQSGFGANSQASHINASGQIVGMAPIPGDQLHAAFWTNNSSPALELNDAGVTNSQAAWINDLGQIVGALSGGLLPKVGAFWTNYASAPVTLSTLPYGATSDASCINQAGQIVGACGITNYIRNPEIPGVATLWSTAASAPLDLNTAIPTNAGWILIAANGVNDSGVIVGQGAVTNASVPGGYLLHAFALIPIAQTTNASGADLSVSASAAPDPVGLVPGGLGFSNLVYSLTVSNAGPATATGVTVSNQMPFGVNFVSATGGSTPTNSILLVNLGSLAAGATDLVQIVVQPTSQLPGLGIQPYFAELTNAFQVFADQTDLLPTNNSVTVVVGVNGSTTSYTTSTLTFETNLAASVNQQVTNYSTELIAVMPDGTVVYSNAFTVPFSLGALQTAITTAATDLTNAGASSYTGPTETTFLQSFQGNSSVMVTNVIGTNVIVSVNIYIGPTNILVGNNQTNLFTVPPGGIDIDTLITSDVTNLLTTTITSNYLASSVYMMTGIVAQADLSLAASAAPEVHVNSNLVYSITVSNAGPATATDVVVSNEIPFGVNFVSATGSATATNGILLVNLGALAAGATNLIQIVEQPTIQSTTFPIHTSGGGGGYEGWFTNVFQAFADQADPVPTNNSAAVVTGVTNTDTFFTTSTLTFETNLAANVSQQVTNYSTELIARVPNGTVVYSNTFAVPFSPGALQAAIITAATALTNAGASAYTGPTQTSAGLTAQGSSSVTVTNPIGTNVFVVTTEYVGPTNILVGPNQSILTNLPGGWIDFDTLTTSDVTNLVTTTITSNYLASSVYVMTGIVAQATVDVALSLQAAPNPVDVGAPLTYSLTLTNNSPTPATGVVVSNTLPTNVSLISVLPSQGSASNHAGIVMFNAGSLSNGMAATLAIVVVPNAAGLLTNIAVASSAQPDSDLTNNAVTNITTAVNAAITNLVLTVLTGPVLNPQTGLFEQQVEVSNGGPTTPSSVLLLVSGLPANAQLYNATGTTNGTPFVQSAAPLGVGSNVVFLLEFYVPTRVAPADLTFTVVAGLPFIPPVVNGTVMSIDRMTMLGDGSVLVEFTAVPGQVYAIQYSSDMQTWRTAVPAITAPANRVQWIDAGPPKTDSRPAQHPVRYYRVVLLPAK